MSNDSAASGPSGQLWERILRRALARNRQLADTLSREFPRAPFRLGLSDLGNLQIAYQPDSQAVFASHPEYKAVHKRFVDSNRANNGGDWARFWSLILNLKQVLDQDGVTGDLAELGVWRGNTAAVLAHFAAQHDRYVHLFDTFEGFDRRDLTGVDSNKDRDFSDTSIDHVKGVIGENADRCRFYPGWFPSSLQEDAKNTHYCAVSLDCDLYEPMKAGLEFFYPRLTSGGILLAHDYSSGYWEGSKRAVDEFCNDTGERLVLMPDKSGSAFIRKH